MASIGLATQVWAAEDGGGALAWIDIKRIALEKNPDLQRISADIRAAEAQVTIARSDFYPGVALFGQHERDDTNFTALSQEELLSGATLGYTMLNKDTYGVKALWHLFSGFSSVGAASRAKSDVQGLEYSYKAKESDLRASLRKSYFLAVTAKDAVNVYERLTERARSQAKVIQAKFDSGLEARWAVDLARANEALVKTTMEAEQVTLKNALRDLGAVLNQPVEDVALLGPRDIATPERHFEVESHPLYVQSLMAVNSAHADITVARSGLYPLIDVSATLGRSQQSDGTMGSQNVYMATVTFPLFQGFVTVGQIHQANARADSAELALVALKEKLVADERDAYDQLGVDRSVAAARDQELSGVRAYEASTATEYRLGARRFEDWDVAQSRLLQSERDDLDARRKWMASLANWEAAAGLGLEDP